MGEVLDKLRDRGIVDFRTESEPNPSPYTKYQPVPPGKRVVIDSEYYDAAELTKGELLALAKEIEELAHGLDA